MLFKSSFVALFLAVSVVSALPAPPKQGATTPAKQNTGSSGTKPAGANQKLPSTGAGKASSSGNSKTPPKTSKGAPKAPVPAGTKMIAADTKTGAVKAFSGDKKLIGHVGGGKGGAGATDGKPSPKDTKTPTKDTKTPTKDTKTPTKDTKTPANGPKTPTKQPAGAANGAKAAPGASKGTTHKKRAASNCTPLSVDDLKKLPGWKKLEEAAARNWGTGSYNLVVNPEDYKEYPATICSQDTPAQVVFASKPDCKTSSGKTEGRFDGTDGEVKVSQSEGVDASTSMTITQESSIAVGLTVGVSVGFEGIADVTASTSITTELKNSLSSQKEEKISSSRTTEVSHKVPQGKTCVFEYTSKQCSATGKGSVDMIASGWVWFNYNDKTHDHYKWALSIEDTLKDTKDRSTRIEFSSKLNTSNKFNYKGKCT